MEPDHRFIWFLCKTYGVTPDSSFIEDMDEYVWVWMYQSWLQDQVEQHKLYKDYSLFLGSFFNAQRAYDIAKQETPDYSTSDEDFEKSTQVMVAQREQELNKIRHRRRRVIKDD